MSEILAVIKEAALEAVKNSSPCQVVTGVVNSAAPLQIQLNQSVLIDSKVIIVPEHLTDYETEITFDDPEIKQIYTTWNMEETQESSRSKISFKQPSIRHKITVYNSLKIGDFVVLIRAQGGQKFLIIDRMVKNDT